MKISRIFQTARSANIEIQDGSIFETEKQYDIFVNDQWYGNTRRVISGIYGLKPDTDYCVQIGRAHV